MMGKDVRNYGRKGREELWEETIERDDVKECKEW
jgi:hypothetical protein